ncbi:protein kinase domain-containing protein (plasmid) [Rhizobium leguminosarum]|jgi:hypothetical protein
MTITKYLKEHGLVTDVGTFIFESEIGRGGNAVVYSMRKGEHSFAVKFIGHEKSAALARFRDEYFGSMQIDTHPNVARAFHFDTTEIDGASYSLIVMKRYGQNLQSVGSIEDLHDEAKATKGWALLRALLQGMRHLHRNGIIHRDIKPQNIFLDRDIDEFVIGDLGIAHFNAAHFSREAETQKKERMANFAFSAPEQLISGNKPAETMDVFAVGQVLNWYLRGRIVRGSGRPAYSGSENELAILDAIVANCIQDDATRRFQNVDEIYDFARRRRNPPRDVFRKFFDLDDAFRSSIPRIRDVCEVTDPVAIDRFLRNFAQQCQLDEFWYVMSDGGDNVLGALEKLDTGRWLMADYYEAQVERLICYRHSSHWQSFFVVVVSPDERFVTVDGDGNPIDRPGTDYPSDLAVWYEDRYLEGGDTDTGYMFQSGQMVALANELVKPRSRWLRRDAVLIVPEGTGLQRTTKSSLIESFLSGLADGGAVDREIVTSLLAATRGDTDLAITSRL